MKKRELERRLKQLGWHLIREGRAHEIWSNGREFTTVPRHREVNEFTARTIIQYAEQYPPESEVKN